MKPEHKNVILEAMPFLMCNMVVTNFLITAIKAQKVFIPESLDDIMVSWTYYLKHVFYKFVNS